MKEYTNNGICYTCELVSDQGAGFILFTNQDHTKEDIVLATEEIRNSRDVIWLRLATESHRDDMYKTAVFAEPGVRCLRWFEINADNKLIRQERLVGTTPAEYVDRWVLPQVEEVRARNWARFGKDMYNQ